MFYHKKLNSNYSTVSNQNLVKMSQSKVDTIYTQEYVHFIKTILINNCYMEYCNQVYEKLYLLNNIECVYKTMLESNTTDKDIWEKVFNKNHDLVQYYLHLTTNFQNILNEANTEKKIYNQTQLSDIYKQPTFQEYVDKILDSETEYESEYQKFTIFMKNKNFKDRMVEIYQTEMHKNTLKNHLVYIIKLHISNQLGKSIYFTDKEKMDLDIMINAVPYFEYLSYNGWTMQDINLGMIYHGLDTTPKIYLFRTVEIRVLQQINKMFM